MKKFNYVIVVLAALALLSTACATTKDQRKGGANAAAEQQAVSDSFSRLSKSQPVPSFDWSQQRQTAIDVESAQATGAVTTTAGYLEGVGLIWWCPSIGAPVASTSQLSASKQWVDLPGDHTTGRVEVDQGEPTGIYVGQSSGTWTICLDNNGKKFPVYWEGYVHSTIGVISNYPADKRINVTGLTFNVTDPPK